MGHLCVELKRHHEPYMMSLRLVRPNSPMGMVSKAGEYKRSKGSKALRSVLVNIPPSNKSSQLPLPSLPILPGTDSRPVGNGLPPIPESLPSSSNAHPANTRLRPKKKSPKITLMDSYLQALLIKL
ncbi:hypothetical protein CK203_020003 [Vitis vinifera]|uniref:Uncharacterized protein n=1 Tax=Vitis vinifera TaxID=29760 RepID=A0A438J2V9_VITVI|nr:hypothetical protein CK203_020003 [Vitis vinifera]